MSNLIRKDFSLVLYQGAAVLVQEGSDAQYIETAELNAGFPANWYSGDLSRSYVDGGWTVLYFDGGSQYLISVPDSAVTVTTTLVSSPTPDLYELPAPYYVEQVDLGWNTSALSVNGFSVDGEASFQVSDSATGAVCGLNGISGKDSVTYQDIKYGLIFQSGFYRFIESGVITGVSTYFATANRFKIRRSGGLIKYYMDNELIRSVSDDTNLGEALYLDVSLYASGDYIKDAVIEGIAESVTAGETVLLSTSQLVSEGSVTIGNSVSVLSAVLSSSSTLEMSFETSLFDVILSSSSSIAWSDSDVIFEVSGGGCVGSMLSMNGVASDSPYAIAESAFEPITSTANAGLLVINTAIATGSMIPVTGEASGIVGLIGTANNQTFAPLESLASDYSYGEGIGLMEAVTSLGGEFLPMQDGNAAIFTDTNTQGCGILLSTGRHILTAAHVADDIVNAQETIIIFDTHDLVSIGSPLIKSVLIHPDFDSENINYGSDIAIIELYSVVDPIVRRHDIYTGSDEVSKTFDKTSYSTRINPSTGVETAGGWDSINNRYDDTADKLNDIFGGVIGLDNQLIYDFDNGLTLNDALSSAYGIDGLGVLNEGFVSSGDSGSGSLIDGKIAGISSWVTSISTPPDVLDGINSTYGEVASDTRVSIFADWIDANSVGVAVSADIRLPIASINSQVEVNPPNYVSIGGFNTTITAYTGAQLSTSSLSLNVGAQATIPNIARANLRLPNTELAASVKAGITANANVNYTLIKSINAYTGAIANLAGFNTSLSNNSFSGSVINATLRAPKIGVDSLVVFGNYANVVGIRTPHIKTIHGIASIGNFNTKINAKSGRECEVT